MMDGVDTGGSSPALSRQHKPDLPGDGWAVSPLFMDHHPSPISYMPQKPRSLKNSFHLLALHL